MVMGTNIVEVKFYWMKQPSQGRINWDVTLQGNGNQCPNEMEGHEIGTCPVCHQNEITIKGKNPVQCPICGIYGELKIENGEITVAFSEENKKGQIDTRRKTGTLGRVSSG